jgi:hypothetical protein
MFGRRSAVGIVGTIGALALPLLVATPSAATITASTSGHSHIDCAGGAITCTEVYDSEKVFGEGVYVGHDEPSVLFYSDKPGSGNQMQYELTLPRDPTPTGPLALGKSYNFELHPAFWFGMAMCDTQSFPEQLSTCTPDSDANIVDPAISPKHAGSAFTELQFYPPGWVSWPPGNSCDATQWCAALNIDSVSQNPVTGQELNPSCAARTGVEYVNFAFVTKNGLPQPKSPPNPVDSTINTFTPNAAADLFMGSGDRVRITLHDTPHGLMSVIEDLTTGKSGSMTASAANGFGQVKYAPTGTTCTNLPYDFHPMYSTSSEQTRVPWTAHSYNVSFSDEIGHFDFCTDVSARGICVGNEGIRNDRERNDADDMGCFPASVSLLVRVSGCTDPFAINQGFDGTSYQDLWPDGNVLRPTPIEFSSPRSGPAYSAPYARMGFETDLPRVENPPCDRYTGSGCTLLPTTDDNGPTGAPMPAVFYPFFSTAAAASGCYWQLGNHIAGSTNDFGQNAQYGTLLNLTYSDVGGHPTTRYNDFRQVLSTNPC